LLDLSQSFISTQISVGSTSCSISWMIWSTSSTILLHYWRKKTAFCSFFVLIRVISYFKGRNYRGRKDCEIKDCKSAWVSWNYEIKNFFELCN